MELFTERLKLKDVMPEVAKDIAKEYKLKEEDLELVRKNNPLKPDDIKIEDGERAAVRYVNTADVDRDNEIVVPDGLQTKDFLKSPSVLYAHNYRGLPIGRDIWLKLIKGKGWLAKTIYAKHELATDVYNLVKDKFLNTNSIGFIPLESVKPDNKKWDKVKAKLTSEYGIKEKLIDKVSRIYTNSILLEHSDVPIPSNINALNIAVGKGFIKSDQLIKDLEVEVIDGGKDKSKDGLIPLPGGEVIIPAKLPDGKDQKKLEGSLKDVKGGKVEEGIKEEGEAIKLEAVEKPYPNEHACRIRQPGGFQPESFRRMSRDSEGKKYWVIMGRLKGETTLTEQAYRYPKDVWNVAQARKHCKDHKGIAFEPATEGTGTGPLDIKVPQPEGTGAEVNGKGEQEAKLKEIGLFDIKELAEIVNRNKGLVKENKRLKEKIEEIELKAGAVLNRKNKNDLIEAQKRILNVLDSATTAEEEGKEVGVLEIEEDSIGIEVNDDSDNGAGGHTEGEEETIDISEDEIKRIISGVLDGKVGKLTDTLKKEIGDNFKKMTGKVM